MKNTMDRLIELFEGVFEGEINISDINEDSRLVEDIGMNSIGLLYMAMAVEEEFGTTFKNEDFLQLRTVGDVISKIDG